MLVVVNLKGWWRMEEGSGTSIADSSGNGNTGTMVNFPTDGTEWSSNVAD